MCGPGVNTEWLLAEWNWDETRAQGGGQVRPEEFISGHWQVTPQSAHFEGSPVTTQRKKSLGPGMEEEEGKRKERSGDTHKPDT